MNKIDLSQTAALLEGQQRLLLLTHRNPDGDTLGCAFALMYALRKKGKTVKVLCCDEIPKKYSYLYSPENLGELDDAYIVAVDVADEKLLGPVVYEKYTGKVQLCIDHHISNKGFAENLFLRDCAAACEIIYDLIRLMDIELDSRIADCLYTGISTDTGCFKFPNVTVNTHLIAAELIKLGADFVNINRLMFETKPRGYFSLQAAALSTIEMHFGGRCAVMFITQKMLNETGTTASDCDGLAGVPRKIEGVLISATLRERMDGIYKVSLRSHAPVDCSVISAKMGGGGHARAAGCEIEPDRLEEGKARLLAEIKAELDKI